MSGGASIGWIFFCKLRFISSTYYSTQEVISHYPQRFKGKIHLTSSVVFPAFAGAGGGNLDSILFSDLCFTSSCLFLNSSLFCFALVSLLGSIHIESHAIRTPKERLKALQFVDAFSILEGIWAPPLSLEPGTLPTEGKGRCSFTSKG